MSEGSVGNVFLCCRWSLTADSVSVRSDWVWNGVVLVTEL